MDNSNLTSDILHSLLNYDHETGIFTRRSKTNRKVIIGSIASFSSNGRYTRVAVNNERYYAHRLAWLYVYGKWPDVGMQVDHIDGNKSNNSISNLRLATPSVNTQNEIKARSTSRSGILGVHWMIKDKKWRAQIRIKSRQICIGYFDDKQVAQQAYLNAKRLNHEGCTI